MSIKNSHWPDDGFSYSHWPDDGFSYSPKLHGDFDPFKSFSSIAKWSAIASIISAVIGGVALVAIVLAIIECLKKTGNAIPTYPRVSNSDETLKPLVSSETTDLSTDSVKISVPPNFPVISDAQTVERFISDMAKERPIRFSAEQIDGFTKSLSVPLGSGGYGVVYKGEFPKGEQIAVKVLKSKSNKRAVEEQFMAEVSTTGRTYHINLVRLYGFCFDPTMIAVVYEYMENGSLDSFLFNEDKKIECDELYKIAVGTAKGISYLHENCRNRIIHYDIKPGNVLLDAAYSPKVADFGIAKLCNMDDNHDGSTGYRGTPGYSAPEFLLKNIPITYKCDVYSFGMMLFEIVRRRRNVNSSIPVDSLDFFPRRVWKEYKKGGLMEITVECGIEDEDREKAERMLKVALWCIQDSPEARPLMSNVVQMLEGGVNIIPPPKPFRYLYPACTDASQPTTGSGASSSYSTSQYTDAATPVMRKHGIEMARSS